MFKKRFHNALYSGIYGICDFGVNPLYDNNNIKVTQSIHVYSFGLTESSNLTLFKNLIDKII